MKDRAYNFYNFYICYCMYVLSFFCITYFYSEKELKYLKDFS